MKKRAEDAFLAREYRKAMVYYALALQDDPDDKELRLGAILSDMALDLEEEAQALFGYYLIARNQNKEEAEQVLEQLISSIDDNISRIGKMVGEPIRQIIEQQNGISYSDFKEIVAAKGCFREAYEDVLFSTRVIISNKDDFFDFINQLIESGYEDVALGYIESANAIFPADARIRSLAEKIGCHDGGEDKGVS
ncbi:MAG: hypothetical protein K6347_05730 [Campylobacterales bacterium]